MDKRRGKTENITYGQLNQALTSLGFTRRKTADFIAFGEPERDALILLPNMDDEALVGDPHLVTVRNTVTGKGVATKEQLYSLLYARQTARPVPSHSSAVRNSLKGRIKSRGTKRRLLMPTVQKAE